MKNGKLQIALDLDGTLATYDKWVQWDSIGEPIPAMVGRVREWIANGAEVYIFTARASRDIDNCYVTKTKFTREQVIEAVQNWLEKHDMPRLPVTATKFNFFDEFWDDRAVQVIKNTGRTLSEEHEAEKQALRGAP